MFIIVCNRNENIRRYHHVCHTICRGIGWEGCAMSSLIFKKSRAGRRALSQWPTTQLLTCDDIPAALLRQDVPRLPELDELSVVRHFTNLSQKNFSIDTHFYPLGSCTM